MYGFNITDKYDIFALISLLNKGYTTNKKVLELSSLSGNPFGILINQEDKKITPEKMNRTYPKLGNFSIYVFEEGLLETEYQLNEDLEVKDYTNDMFLTFS